MASLIYNSFWNDLAKGNIDLDTDAFKVMLLTNAYTADKDAHTKRSHLTNEVAAGNGYTAGGNTATVTVPAVDTTNDRQEVTLGGTTWPASSFTARYAAYYKARGGAATADELVALIDFGSDVTSVSGVFTLNASTIRVQN